MTAGLRPRALSLLYPTEGVSFDPTFAVFRATVRFAFTQHNQVFISVRRRRPIRRKGGIWETV